MLLTFYIILLAAGLVGFALHLIAQYRIIHILRRRYPHQWNIVAAQDQARHRNLKTYGRLQRVLHSHVPELFNDRELTRWHRCWRYGPWLAWPCWIGAIALRMFAAG